MPQDSDHLLEAALDLVLDLRPQNRLEHDPACPGLADDLSVSRETCPECRDWRADFLRGAREAYREERRPKA